MKAMMDNRYVTWMAVRPMLFGDKTFEPGEKIPQKLLEGMRDPEVLVRTGRIRAVAKDMNKVPRYLRKDVVDEKLAKEKILAPRIASQIGEPASGLSKQEQKALEKAQDAEAANETRYKSQTPDMTTAVELWSKAQAEDAKSVAMLPTRPEPFAAEDIEADEAATETDEKGA